jgi:hypothetical protein
MRIVSLFFLFLFFSIVISAQNKTENIVIVTLDGMRWQEVFKGADSFILKNKNYTHDYENTSGLFWSDDLNERRKKLFPFLWNVVAKQGQLYGNRTFNNNLNNANPYQFSYPGYNELLTGYPDTLVNSNEKINNPNENVLEFINQQKDYQNKVAVFATWDVFPFILNKNRSHLFINADVDSLHFNTPSLQLLNDMQFLTAKPIGVRPDVFTYFAAREYWKVYQPKVLYIAFDETDDMAHGGDYDQYLKSAHAQDRMIEDLWNLIQSSASYKNKTTLIITCDHGRGDVDKNNWTDHGSEIKESGQIWMAVLGPDTPAFGEMKIEQQLYQKQIASTIASLLGFSFNTNHPVGNSIASVFNSDTDKTKVASNNRITSEK